MKNTVHSRLWAALRSAFVSPSPKQWEAYGRFAHNLSAVCFIGGVTIIFSDSRYGFVHIFALLTAGVIWFVAGALFNKGE